MAKLTPQELQERRRIKREQDEREVQERRAQEQRVAEERAAEKEREARENAEQRARAQQEEARRARAQQRYSPLESSLDSLYEEVDKLAKKAPATALTDLNLLMLNDLIADIKEMVGNDRQLKRIDVIEAAGDNPQYRDALIILGQLRAALDRFRANDYQRVEDEG